MRELYQLRYQELLAEFDQYILEHPEFVSQIPDQAQVVLVDEYDPGFSRWCVETFGQPAPHDDCPGRPSAFVEVGELTPQRSRLQRPHVIPAAPTYALA